MHREYLIFFFFSRIELIRQVTPREQQLNAPNLEHFGINFDWLHKKHLDSNRTNDSIALYRYLDVSRKKFHYTK